MLNWFRKMLYGRYGSDVLGRALLIGSLGVLLVEMVTGWRPLSVLAVFLLGISYFRIFSKNITARRMENEAFLRWWNPTAQKLRRKGAEIADQKTHLHCKCPSCGQKIRVPRGRGKLRIACPKCGHSFDKKT